ADRRDCWLWPLSDQAPPGSAKLDRADRRRVVCQPAAVLQPRRQLGRRRLLCLLALGVHRRRSQFYRRVRSTAVAVRAYATGYPRTAPWLPDQLLERGAGAVLDAVLAGWARDRRFGAANWPGLAR